MDNNQEGMMADTLIETEYQVDLSEEEIKKKIKALGELIALAMRDLALRMGLKVTGDYSQGFLVEIQGTTIIIENKTKYAEYLEYGTYEYFAKFGTDKFSKTLDPKKKNLKTKKEREAFPKGGQPFAVMRRVLFNKTLMNNLIRRVFG